MLGNVLACARTKFAAIFAVRNFAIFVFGIGRGAGVASVRSGDRQTVRSCLLTFQLIPKGSRFAADAQSKRLKRFRVEIVVQMLERVDTVQNDFLVPDLGHIQFVEFVRSEQQQTTAVDLIVEEEVHVWQDTVFQSWFRPRKRNKRINQNESIRASDMISNKL